MNPSIENFFTTGQFGTPFNCVPFDQIKTEDFVPLIQRSVIESRAKISSLKGLPPSFENTILGLENSSEAMDVLLRLYFNLFSAHATAELQALAQQVSSMSAEFSSEVNLDEELFLKVKAVYDSRAQQKLNKEQLRLLEKTFKSFARNGALLPPEKKNRLKEIDQEMAAITPQFSENVLKATNEYFLTVEDSEKLKGIPEAALEAAQEESKKRNLKGWTFTLQAPSLLPFLKYCPDSELRHKIWFAFNSRSFNSRLKADPTDNQSSVLKIVQLRHERAKLLGYATHADYVLEERMAQNTGLVHGFLDSLLAPSRQAAEKDIQELKDYRKKIEGTSEINPWDFAFYSEKLRQASFDLSEEELRPYFQLENAVKGVFEVSRKLYGVTFEKVTNIPIYHPEVETYLVREEATGDHVGVLYADFFPRDTKRAGAWKTAFNEQGLFAGKLERPHVAIVCNFTKASASRPSLLTFDEVETLFHEFGHALHCLLSKCTYRSLSGTNVYWDFVELPSQIMENWLHEKEVLTLFAKHYQTAEIIPDALIEKIKKADRFQAGYASLRQITFGLLDMAWHGKDPSTIASVDDLETKALDLTRIFPKVEGTNMSCSFSHIFAGGYSAGYYSYKWAEVLDADAFELFLEKGLFNPEVSHKFRDTILSRGDTDHPAELYRQFRGRDPDPQALLRRSGFQ